MKSALLIAANRLDVNNDASNNRLDLQSLQAAIGRDIKVALFQEGTSHSIKKGTVIIEISSRTTATRFAASCLS